MGAPEYLSTNTTPSAWKDKLLKFIPQNNLEIKSTCQSKKWKPSNINGKMHNVYGAVGKLAFWSRKQCNISSKKDPVYKMT